MPTSGPAPRKDRFTALDALALARELCALDRARAEKSYDLAPNGIALVLRTPGEGPRELVLVPGRYGALLEPTSAHPDAPGPLARELRRVLGGARLTRCLDPEGERVVELEFSRADLPNPFLLTTELFPPGNLYVVQDGKFVVVAKARRFASRQIRVGVPFVPAPKRPDPFELSASALAALLRSSTVDLASTLAARAGFGGPIAEELIARAGLAPSASARESPDGSAAAVAPQARRLLDEVGESPNGYLYTRNGEPWDATPYESKRWVDDPAISVTALPSFSRAAAAYFPQFVAPLATPSAETSARASQERQLRQQREAIAALEQEARTRLDQAEAIYTHYPEAEARLTRAGRQPGGDVVELELEGMTVPLRRGRTVEESVQWLYAEAKRAQSRLEGARLALAETERQIAAGPAAKSPVGAATPEAPRRRSHWFEKFRWFIASSGEIVVGGRDAGSNDLVVRKYLKARDLYVHADLHGASSVVVKHLEPGGEPPSSGTLQEAGQWAVSYSKAWRAGLASASAFWVTSEQVSKSAGAGEFVARGSWVITGRKHLLADLPLELAIGPVRVEGQERLSVAPVTAIQSRGEVRFLLTPGDERERGRREVELAEALGIPRDLLQAMLPAGGLSVRRA